jgi:hypothetical protein
MALASKQNLRFFIYLEENYVQEQKEVEITFVTMVIVSAILVQHN